MKRNLIKQWEFRVRDPRPSGGKKSGSYRLHLFSTIFLVKKKDIELLAILSYAIKKNKT